ncbi:MAG: hypothetical protein AAF433_05375 [Bacteroidota bacterium]
MDLIITLLAIYGGYRLWKWYSGLKQQIGAGPAADTKLPPQDKSDVIDIDYEEID